MMGKIAQFYEAIKKDPFLATIVGGIIATVIGGIIVGNPLLAAIICCIFAIVLVVFIIFRLRKKEKKSDKAQEDTGESLRENMVTETKQQSIVIEATGKQKDFFISYSGSDSQWAEWIAWILEEEDYSVVIQAWDFRPGANFVMEMDKAAKIAKRTIAVLSQEYLNALYTHPEWAAAFAKDPKGEKGTLLPVRVRECKLKGLLAQVVYIDLVGLADEEARNNLIAGVRRDRAKPSVKPEFPEKAPRSVPERPLFPGLLPEIWNVPHNRNRNFTGREDLLSALGKALIPGEPTALTQAISGLGGVGKTQLALEYTYRHFEDYSVVWWVRAEEPATLAGDYAALAEKLVLPEKDQTDQSITVEAVKLWLGQNTGWLLVFDNAEGPDAVREFLPQGRTGHVIITSRNPNWGGAAEPLTVNVLEPDEAVSFLLKRTSQKDKVSAEKLAKELGFFPLALEQAGAYMESTGKSLSDYLELFGGHRRELMAEPSGSTDYQHTVATTWEIAFNKVREESPAGADLLNLCAFLAPEKIPLELIASGAEHLPKKLAAAAGNPLELDRAVAALRRYSLVEAGEKTLSVHRLVQAVARDRLAKNAQKTWAGAALRMVNSSFQYKREDLTTWPASARLLPHALAAAGHAGKLKAAQKKTGRLLNEMGLYLLNLAELASAKSVLERALSLCEETYGPNHPKVATVLNNLGLVLKNMGDLEGAKKNFERALKMGEKTYGPNHPKVAIRINNLGMVLKDMGDLEGAKKNFERALKMGEKTYGPNHPKVATRINNLGMVLQAMGDLEGAKKNYERALKIDEETYGPNHPEVATDLNNLGDVLQDMGDLEGAKKNFEKALKIFREFLGEDHRSTVIVRKNLESLEKKKGG